MMKFKNTNDINICLACMEGLIKKKDRGIRDTVLFLDCTNILTEWLGLGGSEPNWKDFPEATKVWEEWKAKQLNSFWERMENKL